MPEPKLWVLVVDIAKDEAEHDGTHLYVAISK